MAFWKKSEDPWDRNPEKRKHVPEAAEPPVWAQPKRPPAPMSCPWCGSEMTGGNLYSAMNRGAYQGLYWREGEHKSFLELMGNPAQAQYLNLGYYEEAWYCRKCQKLVLDVEAALQQQRPNYEWKDGKIVFPEDEENHDL